MNDLLEIFEEGLAEGWFVDTVNVVRRDGVIFDFLLEGEELRPGETVRQEKVVEVMREIRGKKGAESMYKFEKMC